MHEFYRCRSTPIGLAGHDEQLHLLRPDPGELQPSARGGKAVPSQPSDDMVAYQDRGTGTQVPVTRSPTPVGASLYSQPDLRDCRREPHHVASQVGNNSVHLCVRHDAKRWASSRRIDKARCRPFRPSRPARICLVELYHTPSQRLLSAFLESTHLVSSIALLRRPGHAIHYCRYPFSTCIFTFHPMIRG